LPKRRREGRRLHRRDHGAVAHEKGQPQRAARQNIHSLSDATPVLHAHLKRPGTLKKIDAAENAHAREIENLATLPQNSPAITALRSRIIQRFGELEAERTQINDRLTALDQATA
jgi:hypothetical protein